MRENGGAPSVEENREGGGADEDVFSESLVDVLLDCKKGKVTHVPLTGTSCVSNQGILACIHKS